ncbi:Ras-related and estrogen-regulated growth inhibitor-like 2 [Homarus americanus]|uniref:small monomeric GTPase n=1 Tax=Homarus americanus TaxID=6706 RepID=A0A8J5MXN2_HOMAM|nr:Ras-related and estrogen-regulated growth inhibitor-like 2 [Homarus americanus]
MTEAMTVQGCDNQHPRSGSSPPQDTVTLTQCLPHASTRHQAHASPGSSQVCSPGDSVGIQQVDPEVCCESRAVLRFSDGGRNIPSGVDLPEPETCDTAQMSPGGEQVSRECGDGTGEPRADSGPSQDHAGRSTTCGEHNRSFDNLSAIETASGTCTSCDNNTISPQIVVRPEDNGSQVRSGLTHETLWRSDSWESCSTTSSGYSDDSVRSDDLSHDSENDIFIDCGHDDFPFCQCLNEKVGGTSSFHCEHDDFPFCDCLAQAAAKKHKSLRYGSPRGERRRQRGYIRPSLSAFRDAGLEVFDETEESDFQESETEADTTRGHGTDVDSDYTAGLESDVEGAVGYTELDADEPSTPSTGLLAPPGLPGVRRASIVTSNSRRGSIQATPEPVKVAVFGSDGVGKSALIVRLLTGRFIGEYDPTMEAVYNYLVPLPGHDLPLQVMDTAGQGRERQVSWGEGFLLVFSLTCRRSFLSLGHLRRVILELTPGAPRPLVLVGNKADLTHAREVTQEEIRDLADLWGCEYYEVAAPEPWEVVVRPFTALYQAVLQSRGAQ